MNRSDEPRKFAILERLECTRFLEPERSSILLDFAMEHSKADLILPKSLPSYEKYGMDSALSLEDLSLVALLLAIGRYIELAPQAMDSTQRNLPCGYGHLEHVHLHKDRIGLLWSHSHSFPTDDKA